MTKTTTDRRKEACRIARAAGLYFVAKGTEYRISRSTTAK